MWYLFTAIPLSLKAGVLGRLLLPVPPFQRNAYPHLPPVWSSWESSEVKLCLLICATNTCQPGKKNLRKKSRRLFSFPFRRGGAAARGAGAEAAAAVSGRRCPARAWPPGSLPPPPSPAQGRAAPPREWHRGDRYGAFQPRPFRDAVTSFTD